MDLHLIVNGDDCIGNATKSYRSVAVCHKDRFGTYSSLTACAIFTTFSMSYALAVKSHNLMHENDPDNAVSTPNPMSPHVCHSYGASEIACCGRQGSVEIATS